MHLAVEQFHPVPDQLKPQTTRFSVLRVEAFSVVLCQQHQRIVCSPAAAGLLRSRRMFPCIVGQFLRHSVYGHLQVLFQVGAKVENPALEVQLVAGE